MNWYYVENDQQAGPADEPRIIDLIKAGVITGATLVWCEGMSDWTAAMNTDLSRHLMTTPPTFPPAPSAMVAYPHQLMKFPTAVAILLHFLTLGIFTMVWLNLMHGQLPRVRSDDPSAGKAVGFCFIPFFNLYWIFFTYRRLCLRLDEQSQLYGQPPGNLVGLATTACIFQVIPYISFLVGYTIMTPIFIGMVQSSVNQLVDTRNTTAPRAVLPALQAPSRGLSGGVITAIICACMFPLVGLLAAIAIPSCVKAQRTACINNIRSIDAAKDQAAMEYNYRDGKTVSEQEVSTYVKNGFSGLVCPKGGRYTINPVGQEPACSKHGSIDEE